MLPQHCYNVEMTLYHNIHMMFRQRCVKIVWVLVPNVEIWPNYNIQAMLRQHCGNIENYIIFNVATTLPERCVNIVGRPKYQRSHNIVPTLRNNIIFNIVTMLLQRWRNTPRIRNLSSHFKNKIYNNKIKSFWLVKMII